MGTRQGRMAVSMVLLCTLLHFTTGMAQVKLLPKTESDNSVVPNPKALELSHTLNLDEGNRLGMDTKTRMEHPVEKMSLFTHTHPQKSNVNGDALERKIIAKREAKKPKNTMRRKKFSKKKLQQNVESDSETESKSSKSKSETEEQEGSESIPESYTHETESEFSSEYEDSSSDSSSSYGTNSKPSESSSESDESESESSSSSSTQETKSTSSTPSKGSHSQSTSSKTEEVSLTTVEKKSKESSTESEEIYSGPDSSPPASSDSTDESSASRYISGDSSEISYTMSSSAEDAFPTSSSESSDKKSEKEDSSKTVSKKDSNSDEKSKVRSKSGHKPKLNKKVKKKDGKKITEINIKLNENKMKKGKESATSMKQKIMTTINHVGDNLRKHQLDTKGKDITNKDKKLGTVEILPQHMGITTERVLRMVENSKNKKTPTSVNKKSEGKSEERIKFKGSKERVGMEMMKVKKAQKKDSQKKEDLEHDLNRDYPSGTVEIENWEGTFAPIVGEPYVAPVHHQPDSFWDAIYRSTDPDLPTPPGADLSVAESTPHPNTPTIWNHPLKSHQTDRHFTQVGTSVKEADLDHLEGGAMEAKNKDKGGKKKDKKKPKLTPKEKKQKKREKKDQKSGSKLSANTLAAGISDITLKAAGKSQTTLKTPSEEERESGTTYKPEGAYQYPSFRHPDFNPDTAYDENGIPIHESPGWTPPPTLPGDHRFGKGRSRANAGLSHYDLQQLQDHNHQQLHDLHYNDVNKNHNQPQDHHYQQLHDIHVGLVAQENHHQPQDHHYQQLHHLHAGLVSQEYRQVAEALHGASMELKPQSNHNDNSGKFRLLPAQHAEAAVKDNIIKHKIKKRKAAVSGSSESKESSSNVMTTNELNAAAKRFRKEEVAKEYKAYKITDSELLNKEDSAPLEALNPAFYMHRNMLQAKKKTKKQALPKLSESTEVIAVIVSPQDGHMLPAVNKLRELHKMHKGAKPLKEEPTAYMRHNEARNPLLYKHRNMFKVSDIKEDGMKVNKEMIRAIAMKNAQKQEVLKAVPLEEFLEGSSKLKGRGRENFNPIFINQKNLFHVNTNKFDPTSIEHNMVKRQLDPVPVGILKRHRLQKREPVYNLEQNGSPQRGFMA